MTFFVDTGLFDPCFNIAAEEYLFRNFTEDIILLYINSPSVIIGKHQNAYEEVNMRYIKENNIPLIRRISGGGSVFHDKGNLNFTFIGSKKEGKQINFVEQTKPVLDFLKGYGLLPRLGEKNEIRLGDWKFSGNAEHFFKNRVMHHGTLLFSSQLDKLGEALKTEEGKYTSRSVKSNRTNVGLLSPHLPELEDIFALKEAFGRYLKDITSDREEYSLKALDKEGINKLIDQKYSCDNWNYSYGPDYVFTNRFSFKDQITELEIIVKKGIITEIKISGSQGLKNIMETLRGKEHLFDVIYDLLRKKITEGAGSLVYKLF